MANQERVVSDLIISYLDADGQYRDAMRGQSIHVSADTAAWLDGLGALEPVGGRKVTEPVEDVSQEQSDRPAGNASLQAWIDYALANGKTEADVEGLGRDAIRDLFVD